MSNRIDSLIAFATSQLNNSSPSHYDTARLDAELLMSFTLKKNRAYLLTWPEQLLAKNDIAFFQQLVEQRKSGTPIAYLIGEKEFWNLQLKVNKQVLIPRPDTELLVEIALSLPIPENAVVADLGTGSGAIALAIAKENPHWHIYAVDKSLGALTIAKENAAAHAINNVSFLAGNWCQPLANNRCHMIISNPPYIKEDDIHLKEGDVRFEPRSALSSGKDGLNDIRQIIHQSAVQLIGNGWLLIEHGHDQGTDVANLFAEHGYMNIRTEKDLANHNRATFGTAIPKGFGYIF